MEQFLDIEIITEKKIEGEGENNQSKNMCDIGEKINTAPLLEKICKLAENPNLNLNDSIAELLIQNNYKYNKIYMSLLKINNLTKERLLFDAINATKGDVIKFISKKISSFPESFFKSFEYKEINTLKRYYEKCKKNSNIISNNITNFTRNDSEACIMSYSIGVMSMIFGCGGIAFSIPTLNIPWAGLSLSMLILGSGITSSISLNYIYKKIKEKKIKNKFLRNSLNKEVLNTIKKLVEIEEKRKKKEKTNINMKELESFLKKERGKIRERGIINQIT